MFYTSIVDSKRVWVSLVFFKYFGVQKNNPTDRIVYKASIDIQTNNENRYLHEMTLSVWIYVQPFRNHRHLKQIYIINR